MKNLFESLVSLEERLHRAGISCAVIGGVAVGVWGEPRLTRDVDVKVLLGRNHASRLLEILAADYIPLQPDPLNTLIRTGILFVQDKSGTRLDLLLSDNEFDVQAINRAKPMKLAYGLKAHICSAEDLIIYKLISTRTRDREDAASVVRRQENTLDDEYVLQWLREFEQALDDSTLVTDYQLMRGSI